MSRLVKCFSNIDHASFSEVFFLHLMLVLVKYFSYKPHTIFSEVFLLHISC